MPRSFSPEHSTLSKTRKRLSVEAHGTVFGFVLERLMESGLLSGKTLGVDATTLEANAAMRTIVRREDGTERRLAEAGVEVQEVVADKGYHSNRTMTDLHRLRLRVLISWTPAATTSSALSWASGWQPWPGATVLWSRRGGPTRS